MHHLKGREIRRTRRRKAQREGIAGLSPVRSGTSEGGFYTLLAVSVPDIPVAISRHALRHVSRWPEISF